MTQQKPPVLNIKMVPAGINLVIIALRDSNLPHSQVAPLLGEISGQFNFQMAELAKAELAKQEKAKPVKAPRKVKPAEVKTPADDPDPSDVLA